LNKDKLKINISRNWKFPGQIRLSNYLKPSKNYLQKLKNSIIWLSEEPIAFYTTTDSYIEYSILTTGTYEAEIGKIISISLKENGVALDIGCNIGLQSLRMAQAVGKTGRVIAFEPLNYLRQKCKKNFELNFANNVDLLPYALSDQAGEMNIKINSQLWNQGAFSLLQKSEGDLEQRILIKVGDELEEIQNLKNLDLIKIDVEGFELNVMKGLIKTLKKFKPRIIFELDKNYWFRNDQRIEDCFQLLAEIGYNFYQISTFGCSIIDSIEKFEDGNIFCIANKD
jgi:FkbM family methyltransferase